MKLLHYAALLLLFCISTAFTAAGRYQSKKDHFSLQLPPFFNKPKIHRETYEGGFSINMVDSVGSLFQIEQITLAPSSLALADTQLLSQLGDRLICIVEQTSPHAKCIASHNLVLEEGGKARYFLFSYPKGSLLKEREKGQFDTMRGMLLFAQGNKCMVLSYQTDLSFAKADVEICDVASVSKRYLHHLTKAANSFKIEDSLQQMSRQ